MQLPAAMFDINQQWTGVQGRLLQHDRLSIGEKQQCSELSIRCSADEHPLADPPVARGGVI